MKKWTNFNTTVYPGHWMKVSS